MSSTTRTYQEIVERLGFFPPFFEPALDTPEILDTLWQQTISAYLDNPLPDVFKEKLNAYLSRFCAVPYCLMCHACTLRPLGLHGEQVVDLLEVPPPTGADIRRHLSILGKAGSTPGKLPHDDPRLETSLIACLTSIFLEDAPSEQCQTELRRLYGDQTYNWLAVYLGYIRTCHTWMAMHPDVRFADDDRVKHNLTPLLEEAPELEDLLQVNANRAEWERQRIIEELKEQARLAALGLEVGRALIHEDNVDVMLHHCAQAVVNHLDAAFARIWILDEQENVLVLHASAGMYTHKNGPHGRVPVGMFKIGLIAQEREPHLTNSVVGDPRVGDQEWARREGMVAFAGYPLIVDDRVVGVMAMFSRNELTNATLEALGSVANGVALGIQRKKIDRALQRSEELLRTTLLSIGDGVITTDAHQCITFLNPVAEELTGWRLSDASGIPAPLVFNIVNEETRKVVDSPLERAIKEGAIVGLANHTILITKDGRERHIDDSGAPIRNAEGVITGAVLVFRDISDRRRAEAELVLATRRATSILESITDAFFSLDRNWTFTYLNDQAERLLLRAKEDLLGQNIWDMFPEAVGSAFQTSYERAMTDSVPVVFEEYYAPLETWFEVRAYPADGGLSVYFHNINVRKMLEQEQALRLKHEETIASELQRALQPDLPGAVPGLVVRKHYEAALAEASVGGDFFDVFAIEKGCVALIVGDLSGKGLAAATQVSTVRNMLRYALYSGGSLAEAVTNLNKILCEHELLAGFSTLFVGAYDAGARSLTYVNCGQEPALLRRKHGTELVPLGPTGPILGSLEDAVYHDNVVNLAPGDAVAIFTDGLTEVGPHRLQMLGLDGVMSLLRAKVDDTDAPSAAEGLMRALISGVDAYAAGGMRDDVALLVAVVE